MEFISSGDTLFVTGIMESDELTRLIPPYFSLESVPRTTMGGFSIAFVHHRNLSHGKITWPKTDFPLAIIMIRVRDSRDQNAYFILNTYSTVIKSSLLRWIGSLPSTSANLRVPSNPRVSGKYDWSIVKNDRSLKFRAKVKSHTGASNKFKQHFKSIKQLRNWITEPTRFYFHGGPETINYYTIEESTDQKYFTSINCSSNQLLCETLQRHSMPETSLYGLFFKSRAIELSGPKTINVTE